MTYKLTIDIDLMNRPSTDPAMATLKRWMTEGKIELVDAQGAKPKPVYGWPGAPPRPPAPSPKTRFKAKPKGSATFREVAAVIFPHKDAQKLDMGEINGVAHLVQHLGSRNEFFVTANIKDFVANGKRDRLKGSFGIIALTPEEAVEMLSKLESWK